MSAARLVLLGFLLPVLVTAQEAWRFANPKPHGNNIIDLAFHDGVYWEVGDRGSIYTSTDLDAWIPHEMGLRHSLRALTFFQGQVYISGEEGLVLSGANPDALSRRDLGTADWLEGIAASTSALVTVGDNGAIYFSPDGQNWARQGTFDSWLRSVAFGLGQFVCVGENGFIAVSADGQTWNKRPGPKAHLNQITFLNDRFWVVGDSGTVLTNDFRLMFNPVNTGVTNNLFGVAANESEVVLAGDQIVLLGGISGGPWQEQSDPASPNLAPLWPYYSALWDGRLFLLGGRTGLKVEGYRTNSGSPIEWHSQVQPSRNWLWSVTRAPDLYAAAGAGGAILTSLDGFSWNREVVPSSATSEILLGIGGNSNALIAAGSGGLILTSPNVVTNSISTNSSGQIETNEVSLLGVIWNPASSGTANDLQGVAASDSTFVVTGAKGTILGSSNGSSWSPRISGVNTYLSGAVFGPGGFLACGDAGVILSSANGTLWIPRNSGSSSWIYNIRYVGGKLIAVGQGGLILASDDGSQWTRRDSGLTAWINDVTFAGGRWYAVATGGWIVSSSDSIQWTAAKAITARSLYGAATDGDQIISVGLEGVILRRQLSSPATPVDFLSYDIAGGASLFLFGGIEGQRFSLESNVSLSGGWTFEANLELNDPSGTLIYQRTNAPESARFFRTRLLQP